MKIKTILIILFLLLSTTSCGYYWYKPYGQLFSTMPKGGSPGFILGWRHGCESGMATNFGTGIYTSIYRWRKDPLFMVSNPDIGAIHKKYAKELRGVNWNDPNDVNNNIKDYKTFFIPAYNYCRHTLLGTEQMAGMTPTLAGQNRFNLDGVGFQNVFKMDGAGDARWKTW